MTQLAYTTKFQALPVAKRRLERLDAREPLDVLQSAVSRLNAAGVIAEVRAREPIHIRGGRSVRKAGGFEFFEEAFFVLQVGDTFEGAVEGRGGSDERVWMRSMGEAIDFIVDAYRQRG